MPLDDRLRALRDLRRRLPPQTVLITAGGASDTQVAVSLSSALAGEGADAILSVVPPYNRPMARGVFEHFTRIADACPAPIVVSNVPGRTGTALDLDTTLALASHRNIIAVDEGSGDLGFTMRLVRAAPEGFLVFSGEDELTLPMMVIGAHGTFSLVSNQTPDRVAALVAHAKAGRFAAALAIHNEILDLSAFNYCETNPAPVKAALAMMGLVEDHLRLPMTPLSDANRTIMRDHLVRLDLL